PADRSCNRARPQSEPPSCGPWKPLLIRAHARPPRSGSAALRYTRKCAFTAFSPVRVFPARAKGFPVRVRGFPGHARDFLVRATDFRAHATAGSARIDAFAERRPRLAVHTQGHSARFNTSVMLLSRRE